MLTKSPSVLRDIDLWARLSRAAEAQIAFSIPTLDEAIWKKMEPGTAKPARRFEILREAEAILISQQTPVCPIFYYVGIQLYDPAKLGGIESNVLDEHPIKAMYRKDR
jgi:DNA repair photolyase